jgi:serine/threonine protein phosphatase 1
MKNRQKFAKLCAAQRIWAVSSIHGEAARIERLHKILAPRLRPGDRVVYLGNIIGRGPGVAETIDALLGFRTAVMAGQGGFACDLAYLRGSQEEMWQKLLQIQFATDPPGTLSWMLDQGLGPTLEAYGSSAGEARRHASGGAIGLTRWTAGLRAATQARPGHYQLFTTLRRAAFTDDGALLFVNTGLDSRRPLETQKDTFWWSSGSFARITEPYGSYRLVVRGFDPEHPGLQTTSCTVTLDGGCGFGGPLLAACITPAGEVSETLEA